MMVPIWAKSILFILVYMISGLVLAIIIEGLSTGTELIPLNTIIEQGVVHIRTPLLTTFLVFVTKAGNPFVLWSTTALIATLLIIRRHPYDAIVFVIAMTVAVAGLTMLKNTFQITRPGSDIYAVNGWSFPSGHATVATTFFFMLAYTFFRKVHAVRGKTILIATSVLGASLICFSRLYLGAHWTLDILAGVALGMLSVSFTILVLDVLIGSRRSTLKRMISS